jgi:hypothetical protein
MRSFIEYRTLNNNLSSPAHILSSVNISLSDYNHWYCAGHLLTFLYLNVSPNWNRADYAHVFSRWNLSVSWSWIYMVYIKDQGPIDPHATHRDGVILVFGASRLGVPWRVAHFVGACKSRSSQKPGVQGYAVQFLRLGCNACAFGCYYNTHSLRWTMAESFAKLNRFM